MIAAPDSRTLVKLACLVAHLQEAASKKGAPADLMAARSLAEDPDVKNWLATVPAVLLPVRR